MMNCGKVRKILSEFLDEETLSMRVEERVRLHLAECPECDRLARGLRGTVSLLQALPRVETSDEFLPNLRRHLPVAAALARRTPPRAGLLSWISDWMAWGHARRMGLVLAPAALSLSLGLYLWNGNHGFGGAPEAVVSQNAYLTAVAREHASYAIEHPLTDPSVVTLAANVAPRPKD